MKKCNICGDEKELSEFYFTIKKPKTKPEYIYYHPECKECRKNKTYKYREDNPEWYRDYSRENYRYWYNNNPELRKRHQEGEAKRRKTGKYREWQKSNPDKIREYNDKRKEKNHNFTLGEWDDCRLYFNYRCAYCGMSYEDHKKIHKQDLHKEHVIHDGANDLSNCVPSCMSCNSSKKQFEMEEWYRKQSFFSEDSLCRINDWIMEDYKKYIKL